MRHRDVRPLVVAVAVAVLTLAAVASPRPAVACSSGQPTFDETMSAAKAVAWVHVVLGANGEVQPGVAPLRVTEVIVGDPRPFIAADPRTGLCGDTIHYLYGDGADVLVAFGVPYFDQVIHPSWWSGDDGVVSGTADMPPGVVTIEGLEVAIRSRLSAPDPAVAPSPAIDGSWMLIAVAVLVVVVGLRLAWRRQAQ